MDKRFNNPFWQFTEIISKEGAKMRSACDHLSNYAYNIIKKRRNNKSALNDLLNIFMNDEIIDEESGNASKLSDKELRDIVLNLILAGIC